MQSNTTEVNLLIREGSPLATAFQISGSESHTLGEGHSNILRSSRMEMEWVCSLGVTMTEALSWHPCSNRLSFHTVALMYCSD